MKIIEYAKAHPWATGVIVVIGGLIFILIVRGGSSSASNVSTGPSDAEIMANAQLGAAQIAAQAQGAQANAAVRAAEISAGVQLNSDNKAAEIYMAQITAERDLGLGVIAANTARTTAVIGALPSLKKKNRDDVLQAFVTGQPYYPQQSPSKTAQVIGSLGGLAQGIGSIFSDANLKENIRHVGYDARGRDVFEYNYKGSKRTRRGHIAQAIVRAEPEKVIEHKSGYKMITRQAI